MTNLISGKEALIALANGEEVLWRTKNNAEVKSFRKQTPDLDLVLSGESLPIDRPPNPRAHTNRAPRVSG